jgi:diguanylate cyclase (GGDEF)-like protein
MLIGMGKPDPRTTLRDEIDREILLKGDGEDVTTESEVPPIAEKLGQLQTQERRLCLLVLSGLDMGNATSVGEQGVVIGRDDKCDLTLRDDGISRRHLEVRPYGADRVIVRDLESTNGSFVRGQRVEVAELRNGEKLLLGRRTLLKFSLLDEIDLAYQREMYDSSTRDGLTGVFNRRYFNQKLRADISFARRHRIPLSLLMFDFDHFKRINDTHGHRTGDVVLSSCAEAMARAIRTEDVLARYGGEEFAIIAPATGRKGARALADRIRETVAATAVHAVDGSGAEVGITVSAGVATLKPGSKADVTAMIEAADENLYEAKKTGRDRVVATPVGR